MCIRDRLPTIETLNAALADKQAEARRLSNDIEDVTRRRDALLWQREGAAAARNETAEAVKALSLEAAVREMAYKEALAKQGFPDDEGRQAAMLSLEEQQARRDTLETFAAALHALSLIHIFLRMRLPGLPDERCLSPKKITVEAAGQNPAAPFLSGSRSARTGMTIARTSKLWYTGFEHAQDFSPPIYRLDTSDLIPPEATRETKRTPGSALLAV